MVAFNKPAADDWLVYQTHYHIYTSSEDRLQKSQRNYRNGFLAQYSWLVTFRRNYCGKRICSRPCLQESSTSFLGKLVCPFLGSGRLNDRICRLSVTISLYRENKVRLLRDYGNVLVLSSLVSYQSLYIDLGSLYRHSSPF